jgi:hypothetical protein
MIYVANSEAPLAIAVIKEVEKQQYIEKDSRDSDKMEFENETQQLLDFQPSYQYVQLREFFCLTCRNSASPSLERVEQLKGYTTALLLGVAYASSIGGCGTIIGTACGYYLFSRVGTGTNLVFVQQLRIMFPAAPEVSFGIPTLLPSCLL